MFRKFAFLAAALLVSGNVAASEPACFFLEGEPKVAIRDDGRTITIKDGSETKTYIVGIDKLWGVLTSVAIEGNEKHYFARINGKLVFDSVEFEPEACEVPD